MATAAASRQGHIKELLRQRGFVGTTELATELRVSDMTIRRDLRRMETDGDVRVVHGGVSLPHGALRSGFAGRVDDEAPAKHAIAVTAQRFVADGDAVVVDAGTTCFAFAAALPRTFTGTVVTNSVPVLQESLSLGSARTVGLGGELLHDSRAFVGEAAIGTLAAMRADTAFVGVAALDDGGIYVDRELERATKTAIIESAGNVVVLAAASKLGRSALVRLGGLATIDALVTDRPVPTQLLDALEGAGVEVVTASTS